MRKTIHLTKSDASRNHALSGIYALKPLKIEIQWGGGDEIIQTYYTINSTQEIRSPIHKLKKLSETDKGSGESPKVH